MNERTILVWFRNDLRTHDNEVLVRALEHGNQIIPVYCFDPRHYVNTKYGHRKTGVLRAAFIRKNVEALKSFFQTHEGDLIVHYGKPEEILPQLCQQYAVDEVYHHREVAFEETQNSFDVEDALWKLQINLRHFIGHTLYHKEDLPFPIRDIPDNFSQFKKRTERESSVRAQFEAPKSYRFKSNLEPTELPSLMDLGYSELEVKQAENLTLAGGESAAFAHLENYIAQAEGQQEAETFLAPYVSVGALSPNTLYHSLFAASQAASGSKKRWEHQFSKLMWRDYYRFMFKKHGNRFFKLEGVLGEAPAMANNEQEAFDAWSQGRTGESLIDQAMQQLNETGLMSDLDRQVTATYLVHHLKVNWLLGASWFEEKLLDYNPCSNYGNWAHIAGVGSSEKENKPIDIQKYIVKV